jgi:hypothetical protein
LNTDPRLDRARLGAQIRYSCSDRKSDGKFLHSIMARSGDLHLVSLIVDVVGINIVE